MYLAFIRMPGESYRRRLTSLLMYLCKVFRALINSLVCWFCTSVLGLVLFQICNNNSFLAQQPVQKVRTYGTVQYHNTNYRKKEKTNKTKTTKNRYNEQVLCECLDAARVKKQTKNTTTNNKKSFFHYCLHKQLFHFGYSDGGLAATLPLLSSVPLLTFQISPFFLSAETSDRFTRQPEKCWPLDAFNTRLHLFGIRWHWMSASSRLCNLLKLRLKHHLFRTSLHNIDIYRYPSDRPWGKLIVCCKQRMDKVVCCAQEASGVRNKDVLLVVA